jgi:Ca2+-binding EF-hand superfamily protein
MSDLFDFDESLVKNLLPKNFEDVAKAAFKETDTNNSGSIDHSELKKLLVKVKEELGFEEDVTDEDVDEAISSLDKNKNAQLEYVEFRKLFIGLYIIKNVK